MKATSGLRKPRPPELNLLRACVGIAVLPLIFRGTSCGQDFDFHFDSWLEVARQWHQGVIYPHWLASANYGAGEPRFVFYPPLSWTLGGILGTIFPSTWAPFAYICICVLAMGIAFYKMACEWMPPRSAELAACLYATSPYVFFVIYERSALGELLAAVWMPLLVRYALRNKPSTLQLALVMAALWLTDAPIAVVSSYMLAVIAAVASIAQRRWALLNRAACGLALGLALASIYIIPAAYEEHWVQIARAIMPGMRIRDSFLFEHTGMTYHDQVLRTASWIAVVLLTGTTVAAIAAFRASERHPLFKPLGALAILIAFLLFPVSNFLWNATPELRYVQFPWRWLLVLGLIFATFAGITLAVILTDREARGEGSAVLSKWNLIARRFLPAAAVLLLAGICCFHAWRHFWLRCDNEDNVHAQIATLNSQGFEGTDEYTPQGADTTNIQQYLAPVRVLKSPDADEEDSSVDGDNPNWDPEFDSLIPTIVQLSRADTEHITAEIQSPQSGYAVLRLLDYPAWSVRVNGARVSSLHRSDGLITVPVPAGTSIIEAKYVITPDVWAGCVVSAIALMLLVILAAKSHVRRFIMERNASRTSAQRPPALRS